MVLKLSNWATEQIPSTDEYHVTCPKALEKSLEVELKVGFFFFYQTNIKMCYRQEQQLSITFQSRDGWSHLRNYNMLVTFDPLDAFDIAIDLPDIVYS